MTTQPKPELLAPAGDLESLAAALRFGADAVYVGGPMLHLRAASAGFSFEQLEAAVTLAHAAGRKLYVAFNSLLEQHELPAVAPYARRLLGIGVDAVIVSDLGALSLLRREVPALPVHVSTQANCQNAEAALCYYRMGARRIVLAREMNLTQIAALRRALPADCVLEAFAHGAMCMATSGRCFISRMVNGRSGNRGECTQPCRWQYHLMEQKRPGEFFAVEETAEGTQLLSSRDLCTLPFLPHLIGAGVGSLKIEGRMKSPYYVATVVGAYRRAIDGRADLPALMRELLSVSHRPYCSGFYLGELTRYRPDSQLPYTADCTFAGRVVAAAGHTLTVEVRGKFARGDRLELVSPNVLGQSFTVNELFDDTGRPVEAAPHAMRRVTLSCPLAAEAGDYLRRRASDS